jgi:hypothetical protein
VGAHPQANPMLSRSLSKDLGGACPKLWQEHAKHASVPLDRNLERAPVECCQMIQSILLDIGDARK